MDVAGLWLDRRSCPIGSYFFRRFRMAFNDSSEEALPFLLLCKPLPSSKRSSKTINQIVLLTCVKSSKSMDHTPFQLSSPGLEGTPSSGSFVGLVLSCLPLTHSAPCTSLGSRNTLSIIFPWGLCTCGALFLESSSLKSSLEWLHLVTRVTFSERPSLSTQSHNFPPLPPGHSLSPGFIIFMAFITI